MFQEFKEYMSLFIEPHELVLAGIGLIVVIVAFILGGKQERTEKKKGAKINENK